MYNACNPLFIYWFESFLHNEVADMSKLFLSVNPYLLVDEIVAYIFDTNFGDWILSFALENNIKGVSIIFCNDVVLVRVFIHSLTNSFRFVN